MQRTAPSLLIATFLGTVSVLYTILVQYSQWTISAIFKGINDGSATGWFDYEDDSMELPELRAEDSIPVFYPDVIIAYKTRPPPKDQERLDEWQVEAEKISTVKKEVYIVRNPTLAQLKDMTEFSGLLEHIRPSATAISIHSIIPMLNIVAKVSMISIMLRNVALGRMEARFRGVAEPIQTGGDTTMEVEEGEEVETAAWYLAGNRVGNLSVRGKGTYNPKSWGTVEAFLATSADGIFCPFEINYAAPDPTIMARFIQRFYWLFTESVTSDADSEEMEELNRVWASEMANTLAGHHLAHMMACLMASAEMGAYTYILQLPERHYEGSIIVKDAGKATIRGPALGAVSSVDHATLRGELEQFGFHTVVLRKVLDECGAGAVETSTVTSMRHLREIVFAGTGMPDGNTRNRISRLLPKLSFPEKPLGVNEAALDLIMSLLADPSKPIPRSLFLATGSFFVDDIERTHLILAAWGAEPPTFNYGGTTLMATATKGKKAPSGMKDYSPNPPRVLQMRRVNMTTAITGWNTLMSSGYIWGIYDRKLNQSRGFNGAEKTRVWQIIGKWAGMSVVPKGTVESTTSVPGGSGQKRVTEDEDTGSRVAKKKRGLF